MRCITYVKIVYFFLIKGTTIIVIAIVVVFIVGILLIVAQSVILSDCKFLAMIKRYGGWVE